MNMHSLYMKEILSELKQLSLDAIEEIHNSKVTGISLPKLSLSEAVITELADKWNEGVSFPQRGFYRPYVEQTITRYAQDRQGWKNKFGLT